MEQAIVTWSKSNTEEAIELVENEGAEEGEKDELVDMSNQTDEDDQEAIEDNNLDNKSGKRIELKKELSLLNTVTMVVGKIIGAGIFITPSRVLQYSGSFGFALICWTVGGLVSILGGLAYVELGTMIKNSGGEYAYLREAYSFRKFKFSEVFANLLGFLFTWSYVLFLRPASNAVIALTFGEYLAQAIAQGNTAPVISIKLLAISCITFITLLNVYSLRGTTVFINVMSAGKVLALAFISILGVWQLIKGDHRENFISAFEDTTTCPGGIALALYSVLYSYDGWSVISYTVEENKNAERNLPFGICLGVPIVICCYVFVNIAYYAGLSKSDILSSPATALTFANQTIGKAGLVLLPLMVAVSTMGGATGGIYVGSRLLYSTARDGNFLELFGTVHNKFQTPVASVILQGILAVAYIIIGDVGILIDGLSTLLWIFYGLVFIGLLIMRVTKRNEKRPFKVWFMVPLFMIFIALFLVLVPIIFVPNERLYFFLAILLMIVGIPVYFIFIWNKCRLKIFSKISDKLTKIGSLLLDSSSSRQ